MVLTSDKLPDALYRDETRKSKRTPPHPSSQAPPKKEKLGMKPSKKSRLIKLIR